MVEAQWLMTVSHWRWTMASPIGPTLPYTQNIPLGVLSVIYNIFLNSLFLEKLQTLSDDITNLNFSKIILGFGRDLFMFTNILNHLRAWDGMGHCTDTMYKTVFASIDVC